MNEKEDYPVANLQNSQLEKIRDLEQQLNQNSDENIILIAYHGEEPN